ncbi:hypothetical protein [Riemerella columbina]|uniref:hypothetical protein n=1 Tax=Riemerella columbina TaxID=103810 RepID=UPI00037893D8|nr:hypothetical protein [Riemerella columbina]
MKKYQITLTEEQLVLIAQSIEDVQRFASGQMEMNNTLLKLLLGTKKAERYIQAEEKLQELKPILFPDLNPNASLSYNGNNYVGNLYQIYRTMYYVLNKDGGVMNVYSSPALPSGNMGTIEIKEL